MIRLIALALLLTLWVGAEPTWTVTTPVFPLIAPAQAWVEMEVKGPAGGQPLVQGPNGGFGLKEESPGLYRGRFQPMNGDLRIDNDVLGNCQVANGLLGVLRVERPTAIFRTGPGSDYDRQTPVVQGVRLEVLQRQGEWYQVRPPLGWIKVADGVLLEPSSSLGNPLLTGIKVVEPAVFLRLGSPCAWQVRADVEGRKIWLDLPGVPMAVFHVAYSQKPRLLPSIRVWPTPDGCSVEIPLGGRLWGYRTRWSGEELVLELSPAPRSLKGLRVTLDAGHGGEDSGTVGLELKVKEKDLNLRVTQALQKELERAGALVTLTRRGDQQVAAEDAPADQELQARVEIAERSRSQVFISIHHNARPDVKDGRISHGTHVYYFFPSGRGLAQAIAPPLARAIGEPGWMHLWRSFAVIRHSSMPAVLVECNFLSNPTLEKGMLRAADYPARAARGIRQGLEQFLKSDM